MATTTDIPLPKHKREVIDRAVIRFAGDSGDGMQVTGSQFTNTVALYANDILIVNSDAFAETDLRKAQMTSNPLEDHSLDKFRLFSVELERLTKVALEHLGLDAKSVDRCKNFFALGMCYWLYNRSMDSTVRWIEDKFKNKPLLVEANKLAMKAGYSYCEATEAFQISYEIPPAQLAPGMYRN